MPNPLAPTTSDSRRVPFLTDRDNSGAPGFQKGVNPETLGSHTTPSLTVLVAPQALVSTGAYADIAAGDALAAGSALAVQAIKPATATRSSLTSTASADTGTSANLVLALNALRKGAIVYNESTAILYLGFSTTAVSATSYTVQIPASGYYEVPFWFSGQLRGIWAAANGFARVTELT